MPTTAGSDSHPERVQAEEYADRYTVVVYIISRGVKQLERAYIGLTLIHINCRNSEVYIRA